MNAKQRRQRNRLALKIARRYVAPMFELAATLVDESKPAEASDALRRAVNEFAKPNPFK